MTEGIEIFTIRMIWIIHTMQRLYFIIISLVQYHTFVASYNPYLNTSAFIRIRDNMMVYVSKALNVTESASLLKSVSKME
jgi:hypothetical protein